MTESVRILVGTVPPIRGTNAVYLDDLDPIMRQRILQFEGLVHLLRKQAKSCNWTLGAGRRKGKECGEPAIHGEVIEGWGEEWGCLGHRGELPLDVRQAKLQAALRHAESAL